MRISCWSSDVCSSDLEAVCEFARLELRAYEDRGAVERDALALEAFEFLADPPGFLGPVPHADDAKLVAGIELGPQGFAEPPRSLRAHYRRGGQDQRGRAVILLEPDNSRAGEILCEAQDIRDLRTATAGHRPSGSTQVGVRVSQ